MADRTVVYRLQADIAQFRAQMAQASAATQKLAGDLTSMDKAAVRQRQGLATIGSAAGKIGLVAAAGFGAAIVSAANFDQAMSSVAAATHETTANMNLLREAALEAGQRTAFSATEAASAIENLAKAGVSTRDILGGGLNGALDLAAAGNLDVGEAAEIAATALTQFKLAGEDVPHVADLLAAGAGKAQGEVTDLSMALKQSGLIAAQMGISIEETTGTLSAFASAGLIGSDAGTSFRTMLLRLANPTKESAELMESLGINAYDAQGNLVSMADLAGQLQGAFAGQSQATRDAALATLFGSDAIRAANVLYNQGSEGIQEWTNKVNDAGYAAETAKTRMDNLKGDLEQLKGAFETALIGTGSGSQGPLRSLVQNLTDVVNAYNKLSPAAQSATGALLGGAALIGGSIWVGSKLVQGIANTREALSNMGIEAGKAKGALASIGRVAGSFVAVVTALDLMQAGLEKIAGTELDAGTLTRDLEALADGRVTDGLDRLYLTFSDIQNETQRNLNPLSWISSFDPSGFESAEKTITSLDTSLASMVEGGNAEQAASALERLAETAREQGLSDAEFVRLFPQYNTALKNTADSAEGAAGANEELAGATDSASAAAARQAKRAEAQAEALKKSREAATETAKAFVSIENAVGEGNRSLKQFINSLAKQAEDLRDFRINAQQAAKKGLDEGLIASLQEAGPVGARTMRQLANATDSEIARANKAWREGQSEVNRYTNAVGGVPERKSTDLTVNGVDLAISRVEALGRSLGNLVDKSITVTTNYVARHYNAQKNAAGGYITGPGSATSDSIPAWLSNGEFVIKAAAVKHYGPDLFHRLNSLRFAEGGMVNARAASPSVSVGSPMVKVQGGATHVYIDGREIRNIAVEEGTRAANRVVNAQLAHEHVMGG